MSAMSVAGCSMPSCIMPKWALHALLLERAVAGVLVWDVIRARKRPLFRFLLRDLTDLTPATLLLLLIP